MTTNSPRYLLAERILRETQGKSLREWVFEQRKRLQPAPWAAIADRLGVATDGIVAVSVLTLRTWFAEDIEAARAANAAGDSADAEGDRTSYAAVAS